MDEKEKAKAYDEALKRAKKQRADYQKELDKTDKESQLAGLLSAGISALDMAFPQLKESEDEKVRKGMIRFLESEQAEGIFTYEARQSWIAYLEKQKDASKAIDAVERIDKYIDDHLANAHDMKDSNPDKKYYRGWDDALGKMSGILQDVYSGEKKKENADSFTNEQKVPDCCLKCNEYEIGYKAGYEHGCTAGYNKAMKEVDEQKENPKNAISIPADCATNAKCPYKIHGDEDFIGDIKDTPAYHFGFDEGVRSEREKQKEHSMSAEEVLARAGLKPYKDGNKWCILAGENIQEGICGFGDTIDEALYQFLLEVLEKQKAITAIPDGLIKSYKSFFENGRKEGEVIVNAINNFIKQKEQKPELVQQPPITYTYPSDASRDERLKAAILALLNSDLIKVAGNKFTKQDLIEWVERIPTDKPAEWSEEDSQIADNLCNELLHLKHDSYRCGTKDVYDEWIAWIKFLPERFNLQSKQEWSEDDKRTINSLRPSWKPSEEQMEALKRVAYNLIGTGTETDIYLVQLYEQLKKL